jgi:probable HAF family extracellular repeat protein
MLGRRRILVLGALLGSVAGAAVSPAVADASPAFRVVDLGMGDNSEAHAINDLGHVVGVRDGRPFLWRDGQAIDLLPDGERGDATDINDSDEIVGNRNGRAFLWRAGVLTDLGTPPGGFNSFATGINDSGDIAGWSNTGLGTRAFRWRAGVMTDLGVIPGQFNGSRALGINKFGVAVGDSGFMNTVAVRWRTDVIEPLTDQFTTAVSINDHGDIAGFFWTGLPRGFLWHRGEFTEIPGLPGEMFFRPTAMNNRRQIVGNTDFQAFLWQRGQLVVLPQLAGTSGARDVNNRGQIVGFSAARSDGLNYHAVLWTC